MIGPPDRRRAAVTAARLLEDRAGGWPVDGRVLATGFPPLDALLGGGIGPADLVVIGGGPGVGKTTVALQWARSMAIGGAGVVYACYEHDERALLRRLMAMELRELAGTEDGGAGSEAGPLVLQRGVARLRSYGDRLMLLRASARDTGIEELRRLLDEETAGPDRALFVDRLDKVRPQRVPGRSCTGGAAAALKETALSLDAAVVATSSLPLGGASAESDLLVVLDDRPDVTVLRIEKNRRGPNALALEFGKDFAHSRLEPAGRL